MATTITITITTTTTTTTTTTSQTPAPTDCSLLNNPYTALNGCSNLIGQSTQPTFEACVNLCSTTSGCIFFDYVENSNAGSFYKCYLLNSDEEDFVDTYPGIASGYRLSSVATNPADFLTYTAATNTWAGTTFTIVSSGIPTTITYTGLTQTVTPTTKYLPPLTETFYYLATVISGTPTTKQVFLVTTNGVVSTMFGAPVTAISESAYLDTATPSAASSGTGAPLTRPGGAPVKVSLLADYLSPGISMTGLSSLLTDQPLMLTAFIVSATTTIMAPIASEAMSIKASNLCPKPDGTTTHCAPVWILNIPCVRLLQAFFSLMFCLIMAYILLNLRRTSGVFSDPSSIASVASMLGNQDFVQEPLR
ncbi:hypothetical protein H2198_000651 [Neophaeococcomyces mojaviensis]|uniref:Uncharacterized protein n=1 Tax=Neophaeococcomyces mojaviensis TaxID=3383035 RepID=A0ACC3AJ04_9EURO|nr:hypothetical protein H2198_000651 [Knufia sp. JES_112]